MAYFLINDVDYSAYVSGLKVSKAATYNAQTNAAGDTVVDYINSKRTIEVEIIPLSDKTMLALQLALADFSMNITFRNPLTNALETIHVIIPDTEIEYYTIQADKVMYNAMALTFTEL